nr:immunoglobulin heavy chain junction region [Macaca mulatta]
CAIVSYVYNSLDVW